MRELAHLAGVDAAVGEDARAQHVGGEGAGVRPSAIAGGPVDDADRGLGKEENYLYAVRTLLTRGKSLYCTGGRNMLIMKRGKNL